MQSPGNSILTINGGSSSIKFSIYNSTQAALRKIFYGEAVNIGRADGMLNITNAADGRKETVKINTQKAELVATYIADWLQKQEGFPAITAIGHRIVHGMNHDRPELITHALLEELRKISPYDPDHLPAEITMIEIFRDRFPHVKQVACFDTSFHTTMPTVAKQLPLPERFTGHGVQRYGFHGLSYMYLVRELKNIAGYEPAKSKLIIAHLGSGASLAAIKNGESIDTSMGFTPASGIPMSTRTGDLDPGAAWFIMQSENCSAEQFNHLINHESGLLGVSGTSADMKELLKTQHTDKRAAAAVEMFCYQTKKWIGSFAAVLGGADALVFAGGIGERSPEIRRRICEGLEFLGIEIDQTFNENNEPVISKAGARVPVRVMKTNEELMIAELVRNVLNI